MPIRLPRPKRRRPFRLFVTGSEGDPPDQWFGSLNAALRAADRLDEHWKSTAWIIEYHGDPTFGGIPVVRDVVHMRDGVRVEDSGTGPSEA